MEVSYEISEKDVLASQAEAQRLCRIAISRPWMSYALLGGLSISFGLAFASSIGMYQSYPGKVSSDFTFVFVPTVLGIVLVYAYFKRVHALTRSAYLSAAGPFPLHHVLRVENGSLDVSGPHGRAVLPIARVVSVRDTGSHVLVTVKPWTVLAIPGAAFRDRGQVVAFIAALQPGS